jgi:hypothetical protein
MGTSKRATLTEDWRLLTRIAATESRSVVHADELLTAFVELENSLPVLN